jgi:hypothetical protein
MNYSVKYICSLVAVLLICRYLYSMEHDPVQSVVIGASDILIKHGALILVSKSQCCGFNPQCVPGMQSCISQAIRAKYCS